MKEEKPSWLKLNNTTFREIYIAIRQIQSLSSPLIILYRELFDTLMNKRMDEEHTDPTWDWISSFVETLQNTHFYKKMSGRQPSKVEVDRLLDENIEEEEGEEEEEVTVPLPITIYNFEHLIQRMERVQKKRGIKLDRIHELQRLDKNIKEKKNVRNQLLRGDLTDNQAIEEFTKLDRGFQKIQEQLYAKEESPFDSIREAIKKYRDTKYPILYKIISVLDTKLP